MSHDCHYCGPTNEPLRPYGLGGANVCFPCATSTPERERATAEQFNKAMEAALDGGGTIIFGDEKGIRGI